MGFLYNPMYFIFFAFKNIILRRKYSKPTRYSQPKPREWKTLAHMNCSFKNKLQETRRAWVADWPFHISFRNRSAMVESKQSCGGLQVPCERKGGGCPGNHLPLLLLPFSSPFCLRHF